MTHHRVYCRSAGGKAASKQATAKGAKGKGAATAGKGSKGTQGKGKSRSAAVADTPTYIVPGSDVKCGRWELVADSIEEFEAVGGQLARSKRKQDIEVGQLVSDVLAMQHLLPLAMAHVESVAFCQRAEPSCLQSLFCGTKRLLCCSYGIAVAQILEQIVTELVDRKEREERYAKARSRMIRSLGLGGAAGDDGGGGAGRSRRARKEVNYAFDDYDKSMKVSGLCAGQSAT